MTFSSNSMSLSLSLSLVRVVDSTRFVLVLIGLDWIGLDWNRGFDLEALPYNYTDVPPQSFAAVRKNLSILKTILSTRKDARSPVRDRRPLATCLLCTLIALRFFLRQLAILVEETKAAVYERICAFEDEMRSVLASEVRHTLSLSLSLSLFDRASEHGMAWN